MWSWHLPEEILDAIIQIVASSDEDPDRPEFSGRKSGNRDTLLALCRCSKQLCRIAQPLLFRFFDDKGSVVRRRYFLDAILRHPELAEAVIEVDLFPESLWNRKKGQPGPLTAWPRILAAAKTLDCGNKKEWENIVQSSSTWSFDGELAIIIAKAPRLERLQLSLGSEAHNYPLGYPHIIGLLRCELEKMRSLGSRLTSTSIGRAPFRSLRSLVIHDPRPHNYFSELDVKAMTNFLLLPSLKEVDLIGRMALSIGGEMEPAHWSGYKSNVEVIKLSGCHVDNMFFEKIAISCMSVKQFAIHAYASDDEVPQFSRILSAHEDTLELLKLALYQIDRSEEDEPLESWKGFARLREIELSEEMFVANSPDIAISEFSNEEAIRKRSLELIDIYPNSLEIFRLQFIGVDPTLSLIWLNVLLRSYRLGRYPNLKLVDCRTLHPINANPVRIILKKTLNGFSEAGIEVLKGESLDYDTDDDLRGGSNDERDLQASLTDWSDYFVLLDDDTLLTLSTYGYNGDEVGGDPMDEDVASGSNEDSKEDHGDSG